MRSEQLMLLRMAASVVRRMYGKGVDRGGEAGVEEVEAEPRPSQDNIM